MGEVTKIMDFSGLSGRIVTPLQDVNDEDRLEWNRAISEFPLVIVYCYSTKDIVRAIKWAEENRVSFRIRSCSHYFAGYSVEACEMVIDVSLMKKIIVNEAKGIVKIQSGVKNNELYKKLGKLGYPFAGGTCPTVDVTGFALGGGWGYSSRYLGLCSDNLVEIEMVNYKGERLRANRSINEDLFWAVRGAGGNNFGVITSLTFSLPKKVKDVTLVNLYFPNTTLEDQVEFFHNLQKWNLSVDERITMAFSFYNSEEEATNILGRGFFYGTEKEVKEILSPLIISNKIQFKAISHPLLEANEAVFETFPPNEKFLSVGRFKKGLLTKNELFKLLEMIQKRPNGSILTAITFYMFGGVIKDTNKYASAFYYRNANYLICLQTKWENAIAESENKRWFHQRYPQLECITEGSFINFPYEKLGNYELAYYGENVGKLRCIKERYDPCNVFCFQQSIRG